MRTYKKYKQLKLGIDFLQDQYDTVGLSFKLRQRQVTGILNGSTADWIFQSSSPAFLKRIPSGALTKYAVWIDTVPKDISLVYNQISEAALKAGYDMNEKE